MFENVACETGATKRKASQVFGNVARRLLSAQCPPTEADLANVSTDTSLIASSTVFPNVGGVGSFGPVVKGPGFDDPDGYDDFCPG